MDGLKIRVPVSPLPVSMFKGLGASPTGLQFSEVYSALQTHIVDAQENPLPIIQVAKLFEVQKHCALSNHIWDGYWFIFNGPSWRSMPADLQGVVHGAFNDSGLQQRADIKALNATVQADLQAKGLSFNSPAPDSFRTKLREAGFYAEWQKRFGTDAWGAAGGRGRKARLMLMAVKPPVGRSPLDLATVGSAQRWIPLRLCWWSARSPSCWVAWWRVTCSTTRWSG